MAMDLNDVGVQVFGHTWPHDPIPDVRGDFRRIQGIRFSTGYPGGLYLSASMYVPKDIVESWLLRGAHSAPTTPAPRRPPPARLSARHTGRGSFWSLAYNAS